TIRVSLTEDSVYEIPVARAIADKAMSLWRQQDREAVSAGELEPDTEGIDPYQFVRRETKSLTLGQHVTIGPEHPPAVIVRTDVATLANPQPTLLSPQLKDTPVEGALVSVASTGDLARLCEALAQAVALPAFIVLDVAIALTPDLLEPLLALAPERLVVLRRFGARDEAALRAWAELTRRHHQFLACDVSDADVDALAAPLRSVGDERLLLTRSSQPDVGIKILDSQIEVGHAV
ncbi:MAG: hypothetical protein ACREQE_10140, partial [Candidatus Binataceae bacterium]